VLNKSSDFTAFIDKHLASYSHLHLPTVPLPSSKHLDRYYARLSSFYIGLFSWFPLHFVGHVFRQIFAPPTQIETLDEKACINLFVKEVLMRILLGLRYKLEDVIRFYEIWDVNRCVLKAVDHGYRYGDGKLSEQMAQFRQMLQMRDTKRK
jgi:hypothetical protein